MIVFIIQANAVCCMRLYMRNEAVLCLVLRELLFQLEAFGIQGCNMMVLFAWCMYIRNTRF